MFSSVSDMLNFYQMTEGLEFAYRMRFDMVNNSLSEDKQTVFEEFMKLMPDDVRKEYDSVLDKEKNGEFIPFF